MKERGRNFAKRIRESIKSLLLGLARKFFFWKKSGLQRGGEEVIAEPIAKPELPKKEEIKTQEEEIITEVTETHGEVKVEPILEPESEKVTLVEEKEVKEPQIHVEPIEEDVSKREAKKPRIIKAPTEQRIIKAPKQISPENGIPSESKKEPIDVDLGKSSKRKYKARKPPEEYEGEIEKTIEKEREEKDVQFRIVCPFVEIDLEEVGVSLVLPEQQFKIDIPDNTPLETNYEVRINDGTREKISVKVRSRDQSTAYIKEKRIHLDKPVENLEVKLPDEAQGRTYHYKHHNINLYVFVAVGDNRGRMHYLYDETGNINPIPKRKVWVVLSDELGLKNKEVIVEENRLIWDSHRLYYVNMKKAENLVVENKKSGIEERIPCHKSFSIEGEHLVEDYFMDESPLFCGSSIKIKAPSKNPSGWHVWIQCEKVLPRVLTENWDGDDDLTLNLPDDLPYEYGEFQLDFCERYASKSEETLFFRWVNYIELEYPKELLIPDPNVGRKIEKIEIKLDDLKNWELSAEESIRSVIVDDKTIRLEVKPEIDMVHFNIAKKGSEDRKIKLQVMIPRLKWKLGKENNWRDKPHVTKADAFDFDDIIVLRSNDPRNRYDLTAILESNGSPLHEAKLIQKGMDYILELGQFYDTVRGYEKSLTLKVKIQKESQELGIIELIGYPKEQKILKEKKKHVVKAKDTVEKQSRRSVPIPLVKSRKRFRKGRGFSKQEISAAGMTIKNLKRMNIFYDKRRNTCHQINVEALKKLKKGN